MNVICRYSHAVTWVPREGLANAALGTVVRVLRTYLRDGGKRCEDGEGVEDHRRGRCRNGGRRRASAMGRGTDAGSFIAIGEVYLSDDRWA